MRQRSLFEDDFNLEEGLAAKEAILNLLGDVHEDRLEEARAVARAFAMRNGVVNADDVQAETGISLGPAAGSLFRGTEWQFTGQWVPSARVTNHGRMLRVWRLKS